MTFSADSPQPPLVARVSRETLEALHVYVNVLGLWQTRMNLVSAASFQDVWTRHIDDSAQLSDLAAGRHWVDLGSGAGFPGLVLAALDRDRHLTLIESDARKCAFLRHAAQAMSLDVTIVASRIETALAALKPRPDVVVARALGRLDRLLSYAHPTLEFGAIGLFPKGRTYRDELTSARESWTFDVDVVPSRTDTDARILRITNLAPCASKTLVRAT